MNFLISDIRASPAAKAAVWCRYIAYSVCSPAQIAALTAVFSPLSDIGIVLASICHGCLLYLLTVFALFYGFVLIRRWLQIAYHTIEKLYLDKLTIKLFWTTTVPSIERKTGGGSVSIWLTLLHLFYFTDIQDLLQMLLQKTCRYKAA